MDKKRFLLLQARDSADPMRKQEVACFARALQCSPSRIRVADLLSGWPSAREFELADVIFLGGSGDYSAAGDGEWLQSILVGLRQLCDSDKAVFASCWGFQAIARACGGRCIHDPEHSELGTVELQLTEAGTQDPLFGRLPPTFGGQAGHQDHVIELPPHAVLLASTKKVRNQAFRLGNKRIYCTQFHPELDRTGLLQRIRAYPQYVEIHAHMNVDQFEATCHETPESNSLLRQFVSWAS
jgi:GMP synthase (glutamine-hydrolysing)